MNDRKRKILIISLITVTVLVILYIVYLFMGRKPAITDESGGAFSSFSSLLSRKKTTPGGSQINPDGTPVDIGTDTDIPNPSIDPLNPGDPGTINPGDLGTSEPGTPGFNPLPNPGSGTVINPNIPTQTPEDITKIDIPTNTNKNKPCDKSVLPKGVADALCDPGGLTNYQDPVNVINFSLNDEEQAELDRLSRMFARLAPYLKTEADVSREQSNQEAYESFTIDANRYSRETTAQIKSSSYLGPKEISSPFLADSEFGSKLGQQFQLELLGYSDKDLRIRIWDLLGIQRDGLFGNKAEKEDDNNSKFINNLSDVLSGRVVNALDGIIGGPTTCPSGKLDSCGSSLFEKALKIY